jgi:hypothetical protein
MLFIQWSHVAKLVEVVSTENVVDGWVGKLVLCDCCFATTVWDSFKIAKSVPQQGFLLALLLYRVVV